MMRKHIHGQNLLGDYCPSNVHRVLHNVQEDAATKRAPGSTHKTLELVENYSLRGETYKRPVAIRPHTANLVAFDIWTFQRTAIGRIEQIRSVSTDMAGT